MWPADSRTTIRAPAMTGSLPGNCSSDFTIPHRQTGLTGYTDRSDQPEHRRCNCAVARIRVLALDWRQHILATPLGKKDLGCKTDLIYSIYYHGEAVESW